MEQDNKEKFGLKNLIAPSVESRKEIRTTLNDYAYYIIIFLVSLLVIFVPPLFAGCLQGDIGLAFPKTMEAWILWGVLNGATAIANISLFILFKLQAKKNSLGNENFKKANEILNKLSGTKEIFIPRSPAKMNAQDYTRKIVCILLSTVGASITLTSLILSFDWMTLMSCLISIIITLCLSWVTMIKNEAYWTEEYLLYAQLKEQEMQQAQKENEKEC